MSTHTIQVSESVYHHLKEHATRLHLTPEQLIERLLMPDFLAVIEADEEFVESMPSICSDEALAAVQRLTTCFADITIPDLDATLADPLIALTHDDRDDTKQ